jgi:hypothetical protein
LVADGSSIIFLTAESSDGGHHLISFCLSKTERRSAKLFFLFSITYELDLAKTWQKLGNGLAMTTQSTALSAGAARTGIEEKGLRNALL